MLNGISHGNFEWNGGGARHVVQKSGEMFEVDAVKTLTA